MSNLLGSELRIFLFMSLQKVFFFSLLSLNLDLNPSPNHNKYSCLKSKSKPHSVKPEIYKKKM